MKFWRTAFVLFLLIAMVATAANQQPTDQSPSQQAARTKVVLLGTGTPVSDPDRCGPATAIVVDDRAYLVDFGPGVVRRAEAAALRREIPAVQPGNLTVAFATHLHSDHTAGYSDLILSGGTIAAPSRARAGLAHQPDIPPTESASQLTRSGAATLSIMLLWA